jgi:hypothetical protein
MRFSRYWIKELKDDAKNNRTTFRGRNCTRRIMRANYCVHEGMDTQGNTRVLRKEELADRSLPRLTTQKARGWKLTLSRWRNSAALS